MICCLRLAEMWHPILKRKMRIVRVWWGGEGCWKMIRSNETKHAEGGSWVLEQSYSVYLRLEMAADNLIVSLNDESGGIIKSAAVGIRVQSLLYLSGLADAATGWRVTQPPIYSLPVGSRPLQVQLREESLVTLTARASGFSTFVKLNISALSKSHSICQLHRWPKVGTILIYYRNPPVDWPLM